MLRVNRMTTATVLLLSVAAECVGTPRVMGKISAPTGGTPDARMQAI